MNIIFLLADTFRYDNLFDRAAMPVRTPNLDRFHERAVACSRMYISSFPTIPHRTDLTSGRFGWPWYGWEELPAARNHIPRMLPEPWASQLICDCPHLFKHRFWDGFNGANHIRGQEGDAPFLRMNRPIEKAVPDDKTRPGAERKHLGRTIIDFAQWKKRDWRFESDLFMARTASATIEWLEENHLYDPLFLWVDFFDPHEPWDPPEYMVKRYDPDYDGLPMISPNYGRSTAYTPAELRNLRAHYCAEAELVDRWIGRVFEKLDDLDLWKNSVVVFTSDHGFSLGERDRTGKSNHNPADDRRWPIYPEVAQVPCLVAAPGVEGGRTVDMLLQPPDILPTCLDLAGVSLDPPEPFHGRSFAPALRGQGQTPIREVAISAAHLRLERESTLKRPPVVYDERWAYAPFGPYGEPELFDLSADPGATNNVIEANRAEADRLHEAMLGWLRDIGAPPEAIEPFVKQAERRET